MENTINRLDPIVGRLLFVTPEPVADETVPGKQSENAKDKGSAQPKKKLSYKLQRELDMLPERIEAIENEQQELQAQANEPDFYTRPHAETGPVLERLAALEDELLLALERWDELENLQKESS